MSNRGLGIGKDSIFKNTIEENKKLKSSKKKEKMKIESPKKEEKKVVWEQITLQVFPEHRKFMKEQAFFKDKQIREVLSDMIQFYIDNKK
mgnify:CR=1 FL=1|jgi:hypothetical protein